MYKVIEERSCEFVKGVYDVRIRELKKFGCMNDALSYVKRLDEPSIRRFGERIVSVCEIRYYSNAYEYKTLKEIKTKDRYTGEKRTFTYYIVRN